MRKVVNLSLPEETLKQVKKEVKSGDYASVSEFFRHLLRLWNTQKLAGELKRERDEFAAGKSRKLGSLRDLR